MLTPTILRLWCCGTFDGVTIATETLPRTSRERRREGYVIGGVSEPEPGGGIPPLGSGLRSFRRSTHRYASFYEPVIVGQLKNSFQRHLRRAPVEARKTPTSAILVRFLQARLQFPAGIAGNQHRTLLPELALSNLD